VQFELLRADGVGNDPTAIDHLIQLQEADPPGNQNAGRMVDAYVHVPLLEEGLDRFHRYFREEK
jgi:hypothetical protein